MYKSALYFVLSFFAYSAFSQENSKNNQFNQSWQLNSTWVDNSAPLTTNVGDSEVNFNIDGYVRVGSSTTGLNLTFEGGHPTLTFTVRDTLVVYGNMTFGTDAMTL